MKTRGRYASLVLLAACVGAALVFRRFVFVAYYPVVMSAAIAASFGFSLLRKPLCLELAERIPPGILPPDGAAYARRLTVFWCGALVTNGLIALATVYGPRWLWFAWNCAGSYAVLWGLAGAEWLYRRRRFAVVFHTSGSTAKPKRIVKAFATLAKEVAYHRDVTVREALAAKPVFLATVEAGHLYGMLWRNLLPSVAGCTVDSEVIRTPESLLAKMRAADKVFLVTTPSFLARFCNYADLYDVPQNCIEIVTSGALLTADASAAARRVFGRAPLEIFGSTETGGVAWRRQGDASPADGRDWTVFAPVKIARHADGRLEVRSPFSFARRYVLGDGADLREDARAFRLLGRLDRMVKINEERVSLPEMEAKMVTLPGVTEAALVALPGEHGAILGAVIALAPGAETPSPLAMRQKLLSLFPRGTAPKCYRFVAELPRNAQGKVRTADLMRLFEERVRG